jgi:chaperone required for assembly of F1-ATPase
MSDWAAKRFWSTVVTECREDEHVVLLDGRLVKTPAKATLSVPTQAMAEAIAEEWDAQIDKIDPRTMPTTRSANAALDKVTPQRLEVAALIAAYGEDDFLCYRAPAPQELIERQTQAWDPLLAWAAKALDAPLRTVEGVMHVEQPTNSVTNLTACVTAQTSFQLAALHDLVSMSGSLVIGLAAQAGTFEIDDLWTRSRLDELWQIENWGQDDEADAIASIKHQSFLHAYRFYKLCGIE